MKPGTMLLRLGWVFCVGSAVGCSDGLPPEKGADNGSASATDAGSSLPSPSAGADGSLAAGSSSNLPIGTTSDAGGSSSSQTDGAVGPVSSSTADAGLTRGPGARDGKDRAPTVSCADLSNAYRDDALKSGLFPSGKPVDTSGSCGPATLYEPNDQPQQACVIPLATSVASEFSSTNDTSDYFKFVVDKDVTYTIDILWSGTLNYAATMPVGDQTSKLLSAGSYQGGNEHREFTPVLSGPLLLNVTGGNKYEFTLLPSTAAGLIHDALTYEPNNSRTTAAPVCVGVPVTSEFTAPNDGTDFYELQLEKGITYSLKLTYSNQMSHSITALVGGQTLTLLPSVVDYDGGSVWESFTPTTSGPATLWLGGGGRYDFIVVPGTTQGLLQDPVTYEPNDTLATYYPIALSVPVTSELSAADDLGDYFGLQAEAGATYELAVNHSSTLTRFVSMPTAGETLTLLSKGTNYNGGNEKWTFTAPASGLMLIYIAGPKYTFQLGKL